MSLFDLSDVQEIPEALTPARPITSPVGQTIPFTNSSGITGNLDAAGNLWNEAGQYIGKMTSSGPQMSGTPTPLTTAGTAASSSTGTSTGIIAGVAQSIGALAKLEQWASNLVTRSTTPNTGITLEDIVFVVVGLILIGAAVFSFKGTQTVINTAAKTAAKASEVAA
jgi:hypothetical protein